MSTGLERPGGTSPGLPPALLSHEGTTALLAVLVGAPESAPPERSIPRRHLESIILWFAHSISSYAHARPAGSMIPLGARMHCSSTPLCQPARDLLAPFDDRPSER